MATRSSRHLLSNNGKTLITGNEDNLIRFFDAASGKVTAKSDADSSDRIYVITLSPDEKTHASGGVKGTIKLWDVANGTNTVTSKVVGVSNTYCRFSDKSFTELICIGRWHL